MYLRFLVCRIWFAVMCAISTRVQVKTFKLNPELPRTKICSFNLECIRQFNNNKYLFGHLAKSRETFGFAWVFLVFMPFQNCLKCIAKSRRQRYTCPHCFALTRMKHFKLDFSIANEWFCNGQSVPHGHFIKELRTTSTA